ncbi:MAG: nuclear transport factor 2 family protein [Bacteroidota bacterium]
MRFVLCLACLLAAGPAFAQSPIPNGQPADTTDTERELHTLLDAWHKAAAMADLEGYFGPMSEDAMYLGTDPAERWTKAEFLEFSTPYFESKRTWDFAPRDRRFYMRDAMPDVVWFDELLDTWMGVCRGSGVLTRSDDGWKLTHYNLTVAVPNEKMQDYLKAVY